VTFDRFQVCLGYYHYALYGYLRYEEQCEILQRLGEIGYRAGWGAESVDLNGDDPSSDNADYSVAYEVFQRLMAAGYTLRSER